MIICDLCKQPSDNTIDKFEIRMISINDIAIHYLKELDLCGKCARTIVEIGLYETFNENYGQEL